MKLLISTAVSTTASTPGQGCGRDPAGMESNTLDFDHGTPSGVTGPLQGARDGDQDSLRSRGTIKSDRKEPEA